MYTWWMVPSVTHRLEVNMVSSASSEVMQSTILPGMISGGSSRLSHDVLTSSTHGRNVCQKKNLVLRSRYTFTITVW